MPEAIIPIPYRSSSTSVKARPVGLVQLINNPPAQRRCSLLAKVVIKIAQRWHECEQFDSCCLCPVGQY